MPINPVTYGSTTCEFALRNLHKSPSHASRRPPRLRACVSCGHTVACGDWYGFRAAGCRSDAPPTCKRSQEARTRRNPRSAAAVHLSGQKFRFAKVGKRRGTSDWSEIPFCEGWETDVEGLPDIRDGKTPDRGSRPRCRNTSFPFFSLRKTEFLTTEGAFSVFLPSQKGFFDQPARWRAESDRAAGPRRDPRPAPPRPSPARPHHASRPHTPSPVTDARARARAASDAERGCGWSRAHACVRNARAPRNEPQARRCARGDVRKTRATPARGRQRLRSRRRCKAKAGRAGRERGRTSDGADERKVGSARKRKSAHRPDAHRIPALVRLRVERRELICVLPSGRRANHASRRCPQGARDSLARARGERATQTA